MKRNICYSLVLGGLLLSATGCSDWLDVNQSPNDALQTTVTSDLLLTSVQNDMDRDRIYPASSMNLHYLAQHLTKSGDYAGTYVFLTGAVSPQSFDTYWSNRYTRIANLKTIEKSAVESGDTGYEAIAKVLMAIEFRELVDMFGNVPFTEASQGADYLTPKYDDAATIYNSLIEMCESAINLCDQTLGNSAYTVGALSSADIYCHGDFDQWKKYAASAELSLLMRISNVTDVSAQVKAVKDKTLAVNENITGNPGYYKGYVNGYNKMNPRYYYYGYTYLDKESTGHKSTVPTEEVVGFLRETGNPLLRVFANGRKYMGNDSKGRANYDMFGLEDEAYIGVPFGQMSPAAGDYASKIGIGITSWTCDQTNGPTSDMMVMQGSLVGFYLAEAALRGLIDGGDAAARQYYESAVTALFNTYETALQSDASTWNTIDVPGNARPAITTSASAAAAEYLAQEDARVNWELMTSDEEKMNAIQTQKWLSLYMVDPLEAWSEVRRTDMPKELHCSHSAQYSKKIMARFMYPNTEKNLNPDNYVDNIDVFTDLLFWDKENPDREKPTVFL